MKILITGGSGFIGKKIVSELKKDGHKTGVFDLPKCDITDEGQVAKAIKRFDLVIHAAAMADVTKCFTKLDETFDVNIRGTYNIAKWCAAHKKKLIFISTCCVYGNSSDEVEHEDQTAPWGCEPYATSKIAGEAIIRGMPNLNYAILRIGTVYGVGMREALFTYIVLDAIRNKKKIFIDGDGKQTRQLVYIDDLVDGIVRAVKKFDLVNKQIINLCGVEKTSAIGTMKVAEQVIQEDYPELKANYVYRDQRYGQTFEENISIAKAKQFLKWEPTTRFYDGMKYCWLNDERFMDGDGN